jgi:hypothetical protein
MNLQENINRIKQVMGLLNEQDDSNLLTNKQYGYIKDIESTFSFIENDVITGSTKYTGVDKEPTIKNTIKKTIGLDSWNKLDDRTKLQIYSFMYQTDSDNNSLYRWLAGLASAVNSNISRSSVFTNSIPITDDKGVIIGRKIPSLEELPEDKKSNIEGAIKTVKDAIDKGTTNTDVFYYAYINVINDQYKNIDTGSNKAANYKYIWEPRTQALNLLMNGSSWEDVKKWWWNRIDPKKERKENPYKNVSNNNTQVSSQSVVQKIINSTPLTKEELIINDDLYLRHSAITSLPEGLKVGGDLSLSYSKVKSLPEGLEVGGDLYLMSCNDLTSLPKSLKVSGGLFLNKSKSITSLPEGLEVGDLSLRETNINSLPKGLKVNALLYIEYCPLANSTDEALRKMIEPNGNILNISRGETSAETTASTDPATTTQTSDGASTTPPTTQTNPYPDIDTSPFNPRNGDPWRYAYDGTNLNIKKMGSNKTYNLMDPNYFETYPNSKIKDQEKLDKAKAAIKNAYGSQLGMP